MKWQHLRFPHACRPVDGVIACGLPNPDELREAHAGGLRTVVNLCPMAEQPFDEAAMVTALGMRYEHIPISGAQDLTRDNALKFAAIVNDSANHPLVVHCKSGNRAGALYALKAFFADGCDAESALAAGLTAGLTVLKPAVRAVLADHTGP